MVDSPLPPLAAALHALYPVDDDNPYFVPEHLRVDDDALDPNAVADPNGADLSDVDPDAGELLDLRGCW